MNALCVSAYKGGYLFHIEENYFECIAVFWGKVNSARKGLTKLYLSLHTSGLAAAIILYGNVYILLILYLYIHSVLKIACLRL